MCLTGTAASIALLGLQFDSALAKSAVQDLADKTTTHNVHPDLALLTILLEKGLFEKVAGGLQAQLLKLLSAESPPPALVFADSALAPTPSHKTADARSILLPATISLLVSKGYYAQAACLCAYHTHLHPAFANFESGMQQLMPYLRSHQDRVVSGDSVYCNVSDSWPLPLTLFRVHSSLPHLLAAATEQMTVDNYNSFF